MEILLGILAIFGIAVLTAAVVCSIFFLVLVVLALLTTDKELEGWESQFYRDSDDKEGLDVR